MAAAILAGGIAILVSIVLLCWFGRREVLRTPIRAFAVLCVAITSAYVMWMGYRLTTILASPEWCGKALQAEKISSQNFGGLTACVDLLKIQLNAIARSSLVYSATIGLCLLVLIVIVIAGGKMAWHVDKTGASGEIAPGGEPLPVRVENKASEPVPVAPAPTAASTPAPAPVPHPPPQREEWPPNQAPPPE
jgi:hypothetical protein